jgi:hypothetical protein
MWLLNRSAVLLRPNQNFLSWLNALPDNMGEKNFTFGDIQNSPHVYLIDSFETHAEAEGSIAAQKSALFERELYSWCTHEPWWPKDRSSPAFDQWFEIQTLDMVVDTSSEDIEADEF